MVTCMIILQARGGLVPRFFPSVIRNIRRANSNDQVVRVVTDIDDTIKSSGGIRFFGITLGGIDVSNLQHY